MTGENIKERILAYIKKEKSNYAIMVSGEWGAGKTFLLCNDIMPAISRIPISDSDNNKYRPVYVSLSGVSTIERLNQLMFASINLTPLKIETKLDKDLRQFKNQPSCDDFRPKSEIPLNVVYCFDDLERVYFPFIEELLGYINTYIEHTDNKVLFICDETKIRKYFEERPDSYLRDFDIIKEKYIRRTYRLDVDFNALLKHQNLAEGNKQIIKDTFSAGRWNNLRTLQFALEVLEEILEVFNTIKTEENNIAKYEDKLQELIVFYTIFVSLEYKKGVPYDVIQEIDFPSRVLSLEEQGVELDFGFESGTSSQTEEMEEEKQKKEEKRKKKQDILNLYFPPSSPGDGLFFSSVYNSKREPFDSIGEFVNSGEFKVSKFKSEIEKIVASLVNKEETQDEKIIKKLYSIYEKPDSEFERILAGVLESVEKTSFTKLSTYLSLFSNLLVLESHKIHDFCVDKKVLRVFFDSIRKSLGDKKIVKELFLHEKVSGVWTTDSAQSKKFNRFKDCVFKKNEELDGEVDKDRFMSAIINSIGGTDEDLRRAVVESKDSYTLKDMDALLVFEKLTPATSRTIREFIAALDERYIFSGGHSRIIYERGFINKMHELVDNHLNSFEQNRPVSYLAFYNLKKKIEYWIENNSLDRE